ncbi:MAG: HAMP domain-containing histidine kinase [Treponema sp.]|nr:HAMP domain-containing histidine kinase [Treponema sp.]
MKKPEIKVFTKIFAYTMLLVLSISALGVFLFSREFLSFYRLQQRRQLDFSYRPMITVMTDRTISHEEKIEFAREFADNNQSFNFSIQEEGGKILFSTYNITDLPNDDQSEGLRLRFTGVNIGRQGGTENNYILTGYIPDSRKIDYSDLIRRVLLALFLMLAIAVLGALLFAKKVTKPLEDEIIRRRVMEENQRLFFSAASHELKTPIAAARALVEGMIAGVGDYRDHPKYLRECLSTLDSQTRLVSDILDIVKLSGEETEPNVSMPLKVSFDLADLGNSVLGEYRPLAELKELIIEGEFPHVTVQADRGLFQRVLSNVIANAVQYTPQGEKIRIEFESGKNSRLGVLNTGVHISDEVITKIFEPFYRPDLARTRHGSQSGLGLTIVKKALERMKLKFSLENTNEGVLFWMELPL